MLATVSSLENDNFTDGREGETVEFSNGDDFLDFSNDNFLESIDFDDLFIEMDDGNTILPDLEIDSEVFPAEIFISGEDSSEFNYNSMTSSDDQKSEKTKSTKDEVVSKRDDRETVAITSNSSRKETDKARKSSSLDKSKISSHGKKKMKVDWTAELHRKFVEAVEQLGVEKAVPSRILEIMGNRHLTRHNIASHLQKYRSHRKHLMAREAEAANWTQRRQMYGPGTTTTAGGGGGGGNKRLMGPWVAPPTMGFPPPPHFRPLHVWGHPSPSPPHLWPSPPPSFWHPHPHRHHHRLIPPPHAMYKVNSGTGFPSAATGKSCSQPPFDFHPSKESIDAAIEDILSKPWQPLPLGLKAPAVDSVMVELQRQGIQKIPPSCV